MWSTLSLMVCTGETTRQQFSVANLDLAPLTDKKQTNVLSFCGAELNVHLWAVKHRVSKPLKAHSTVALAPEDSEMVRVNQ
jgi:hypothetical protein